MKSKVNFNAESLDSFGVVELNSTQIHKSKLDLYH